VILKTIAVGQSEDIHNFVPEAHNLGKFHHFHNIQSRMGYRTVPRYLWLYTEYASYGDLDRLLRAYGDSDSQTPEPFIWAVLLGLAEALYTLNTLRCTGPRQISWHCKRERARLTENIDGRAEKLDLVYKGPRFYPYVHRDIKPQSK
jgi:serine/threonine protein kinase